MGIVTGCCIRAAGTACRVGCTPAGVSCTSEPPRAAGSWKAPAAVCTAHAAPALGGAPYADRLHARTTVLVAPAAPPPEGAQGRAQPPPNFRAGAGRPSPRAGAAFAPPPPLPPPPGRGLSAAQRLRLAQLCDTTLPTGGFAHSGGIEAALQLGLLVDPNPES